MNFASASPPVTLDPPRTRATLRWLPALALALALFGVVLRLTALEARLFWHDESTTPMVLAGYSRNQVSQTFDGQEISAADLLYYQRLRPDWSVAHTIASLAREETQVSPLYFALGRGWVALWGQSILTLRAWSVLWGVLALPLVYALALELFASRVVAWTALALLAVSPFFFYYAREAREYAMWAAVTLLSCWLVLRAQRLHSRPAWIAYALSVAFGLYTHAFFTFVVLAHGVWLLLLTTGWQWRDWRTEPKVRYFGVSVLAGGVLFLPWALALLVNLPRVYGNTRWTATGAGWLGSLERGLLGWGRVLNDDAGRLSPALGIGLAVLSVALIGGGMWAVYRQAPRRAALLVLALILVPSLALMVPDLLLGGRRFTVTRYLTPVFLGALLAVAYWLGAAIQGRTRHAWRALLLGVLAGGALSCLGLTWHTTAHLGVNFGANGDIARVLNSAQAPLLLSDPHETNFYNLLALSHYLKPDLRLRLANVPAQLTLPSESADIFALNLAAPLQAKLEADGYRFEPTGLGPLFRVVR